jgi:chromosome segregation ATPase
MAQEDIQQLRAELAILRQENQQLRQSAGVRKNGTHRHELPDTIRHDNLLPAFQQQLNQLRQANARLQEAASLCTDLQRSLEILIPALEIQITGWTNEIYQLQDGQEELEQTYASVVERLEDRLKQLRQQVVHASPPALQKQVTDLEKERERMRRQVKDLEAACQAYELRLDEQQAHPHDARKDADENPFTSLNIFDI